MNDNMVGTTCPRECQVRLRHIEERLDRGEGTHEGLWEELKMKVSYTLFFWLVGIAAVILLSAFGAIYHQGSMTLEKVQAAQVEQARIATQLDNHTENSEKIREALEKMNGDN